MNFRDFVMTETGIFALRTLDIYICRQICGNEIAEFTDKFPLQIIVAFHEPNSFVQPRVIAERSFE